MKWTSRKFNGAIFLTLLTLLALSREWIGGDAWLNFLMFIWGGYFIANHMDKRVS